MLLFAWLLAQNPPAENTQPPWAPLVYLIPLGLLFYFMMLRPMRQQEKQRQAMVAALKKNDRVVTSGGIIGVVTNIREKEDEIVLRIEEGRVRVTRSSIARVLTASGDENKEEEK